MPTVTFTSTLPAAAGVDFMKYLWLEGSPVTKTDQKGGATLLDFALVSTDTAFVKLPRGAYVSLSSALYPKWFTGFVTNNPDLTYLGSGLAGPAWGYKYHASSDEVILNLNPIGLVPTFYNQTMGGIITALAKKLCPSLFDLSNVQDGPRVARYTVDPSKTFFAVVQDLCQAASYVFYGNDHKLYFKPQDDSSLPAVVLDGNNKHFTPAALKISAVATPVVNDVTVVGQIEPQKHVQEYFLGTGLQSAFPLIESVFGADSSVLLDEAFSGASIDTTRWDVYDHSPFYLQLLNGYLNSLGGTGDHSYDVSIQSVNPLPMEGNIRFTHGEFDFLSGSGVIASLWTEAVNSSFSGCLYGIAVNGTVLNPICNASGDGSQTVTVSTSKRYCIRTIAKFTKTHRTTQPYSYIDSSGVVHAVSGTSSGPDSVTWKTYITEIDPTTGIVTNTWEWINTGDLTGVNDTYALYAPIVSDNLHTTVTGITVSVPLNAALELSSVAQFLNTGFDVWVDENHMSGWSGESADGVYQVTDIVTEGSALKLQRDTDPTPYVAQYANGVIEAGVAYDVQIQALKSSSMVAGSLKVVLSGTGVAETGLTIPVSDMNSSDFISFSGPLTAPLSVVPSDLALKIYIAGGTPGASVYLDALQVSTAWQLQLVGPNEIDAVDGLAPVATIVQPNSGSATNSTYTSAPQYNSGQGQLVFFSDSVTRTSNVPPKGQLVRVTYRSAGAAIGRVSKASSVAAEAAVWGDNGVRSSVILNYNPRPRTAQECELAAQASVSENYYQHYQGSYTQRSEYFTSHPRSGGILKFQNLSSMAVLNAEEINQVVTVLDNASPESFVHTISFGKPDNVQTFLNKVQNPLGAFQPAPDAVYPNAVDTAQVGLQFANDVTNSSLLSWDNSRVYVDGGQNLASGEKFEVRYTDEGWGPNAGRNLVVRSSTRQFSVPRSLRGQVFFVRLLSAGLYSRYSAAVRVAFPAELIPQDVLPTILRVSENTVLVAPSTGDLIVEMDTVAGPITVTLPASATFVGRAVSCVLATLGTADGSGHHDATVNAVSGDVFSGASTWVFDRQWKGIEYKGLA